MSDTKPRWTPPNWPKSWIEICDQLGIRIAQPDDPIYTNASWRISFGSQRWKPSTDVEDDSTSQTSPSDTEPVEQQNGNDESKTHSASLVSRQRSEST